MKKVVWFFLLGIVFLSYKIYNLIEFKDSVIKKIQTLPRFSFSDINSRIFDDQSVGNKYTLICFFNPECEHCQYMAKMMVSNAESFNNINMVMVTVADSASISKFKIDYHLDSIPKITILRDPKFEFEKIFGSSVVPSFFVYKDRKLVKKIIGETKIENLLD